MDTKHVVTLPDEAWRECNAYGRRKCSVGFSERSASVTSRDIDKNPKVQSEARAAEWAVCLWAGLNPHQALNFGDHADPGFDLIFPPPLRNDIKSSPSPHATKLIWPANKVRFFDEVEVDIFTFVRRFDTNMPVRYQLMGWITKADFRRFHLTAEKNNGLRLDPGTWHVDCSLLNKMETLWPAEEARRPRIRFALEDLEDLATQFPRL